MQRAAIDIIIFYQAAQHYHAQTDQHIGILPVVAFPGIIHHISLPDEKRNSIWRFGRRWRIVRR